VSSRPTASRLLRLGVPRLVLSSLGPLGAYYAGSRLGGVLLGVLAATAVSLAVWAWERRAGRPGLLARFALALVLVQAAVGGLTASPFLFFAPKAVADIVEGLAYCVSCLTRWPLATIFGRELVQIPASAYGEPRVRRVFVRITLAWGAYFTLRGVVSLAVLAGSSTQTYLLVRALMDVPVVVPLLAGSLAYGVHRLRELPHGTVTGGSAVRLREEAA
jgi:hypothetical protein